ncbi:MAG: hydrogenase iron-sulfur subunit [Coprothermobacterota bacterium]|nr:hydrogenase iron-sulfur subunit [Coprothermobacterota bacterium]
MEKFEPKIIAFLCNWCSYAGADLAGVSRFQYPPHVRVIRVPCSGRVNPLFVLKTLYEGADGVLVSGCHPGDCHYQSGNYYARRRLEVFKKLLDFVGLNPARFKMAWISASEGAQFAQLIREFTAEVKEAGPNQEFVREKADLVRFLNENR